MTLETDESLALPIRAGQQIGTATLSAGGRSVGSVPALAADDVGTSDESWASRAVSGVIGSGAAVLEAVGAL